jgi:hypothetical protein
MKSRALHAHAIQSGRLHAVIPTTQPQAVIPATPHNTVIPSVARNLLFSFF